MWKKRLCAVLLCLCFGLLGLLAGLELGFFREGLLMHRLDRTGYTQAVQTEIRQGCVSLLEEAGRTGAVLDKLEEKDIPGQIRTDLILGLDGVYRAVYVPVSAHFDKLRFYCEDEAAQFDRLPATEQEMVLFTAVEQDCEQLYQEQVRPPLEPVLGRMVHWRSLRKWFWLAAALPVWLLAGRTDRKLLRRCGLAAGAVPLVLGPVLRRTLDYAAWIGPDRRDHALYLSWMGAGFTALTLTGGLLLAALLLWNLYQERKSAQKN